MCRGKQKHEQKHSLSLKKGQAASMSLLTFVAGHCRPKVLAHPQQLEKFSGERWKSLAIIISKETGSQPYQELDVALRQQHKHRH